MVSKPFIIEVFPVPGAPVMTIRDMLKTTNLTQSNEIASWKKNYQLRPIFEKKDMEENRPDDFYSRLRQQLLENTPWPSDYLYKFIVPTDKEKIDQINAIFDNLGAVIQSKKSKKGTYTSISITVNMKNPDEVIKKYKQASTVEGVISL